MDLFTCISLLELDRSLFHLINYEWTSRVADTILPLLRDKYFWLPIYVFIITFSLYNFGRRSYLYVIFLIVCVGTSDAVSSHLIKKTVKRVRPCKDKSLTKVRPLVRCGSGYSFTSSHAANHFALSFFLMRTLGARRKKLQILLFVWAAAVSYAQVYVGVHFPVDVFSGAILGIVISKFYYWMYRRSGQDISTA